MLLRLLIFLTCSAPTLSVSADARVDIGAITMSGIASAVKPNGQRKASEPPNSHTQVSNCIKRSFRRTYGRACRTGGAYYKGHWRRQDWFRGSNLRPQLLPNIRPQRQAGPHWRTLCWNAGGLTTSVFQELETYVRDHSIDIVLIQESKWTHDSTWTNKDYHYVHSPGSGKHDRYGGLLIMISTRLAKAEDIQFYAPHPGRLLHVRIPHGSTHVDILNWYQYAINQQDGIPDRRQKLLMQIQKTIAHLPRRNVLLLGGDFNCPCGTGSPILWSAFTALLCTTVEHQLHPQWSREHLSLYADDSHLRWRFDTYQGFEQATNEMRIVFACFRRFSLRINLEKTKAMLKVVGTLKHRLKKEYIRKHDEQRRRLLLSARNPAPLLTLVLSTEYLGLIISYDSFEQQSLRHRLQKAHGRRWALASVLHSNRLSIRYKLNIWRSCVYTTLRYGLVHCGLNGDQVADMQRAVMKHTRAIVNNQAFLTGDTHETIIQKYRLPRVLQDLAAELQQARDTQCKHLDWFYSDTWQQHLEAQLSLPPRSTESGGENTHTWACPFCEHMFPTSAALKHHARRTHNYVDKTELIFNKAVHSVGGSAYLPVLQEGLFQMADTSTAHH